MTAYRHLLVDERGPFARAAIRAGTEVQALAFHQRASLDDREELKQGVAQALSKRDALFGDYRTGAAGAPAARDRETGQTGG